ncbi:hypothetical protein K438DRAFT_1948869 [Mycena galopus ATCC 62051]|nr:hypothetical protein K438DRAFT_1948869 [Mycena galopus ATCC 62051]
MHASGKLSVTERILDEANQHIEDLTHDLLEATKSAAKADSEADKFHCDIQRMQVELTNAQKRIQQLEHREDELKAQLERVDDGRSRKRTSSAVSNVHSTDHAVAGPARAPVREGAVLSTEPITNLDGDIPMVDASVPETAHIDWNRLEGIPRLIIRFHIDEPHVRPRAEELWVITKSREPASIKDWNAARQYAQLHKSWSVELTIFSVYYGARHAPSNALTSLQQHALNNYCMPFWSNAKPEYGDPVTAYAAVLQRNDHAPAGCPFVDKFQTLESRLVRGAMLWNALNVAPIHGRTSTAAERKECVTAANALLLFLVFPHGYRRELASQALTVAPIERIQPWPCDKLEPDDLSDSIVASRLATMGLSADAVDDAFDFLQNLAAEIVEKRRPGWDITILESLIRNSAEAVQQQGRPQGKIEEYGELLIHPPGLPWASKELNTAQENGLFLENIPLPPLPGSTTIRYFTFKPERVPETPVRREHDCSHDRVSPQYGRGGTRGGYRGGNRGGIGLGRRGGYHDNSLRGSMHAPASVSAAAVSLKHNRSHSSIPHKLLYAIHDAAVTHLLGRTAVPTSCGIHAASLACHAAPEQHGWSIQPPCWSYPSFIVIYAIREHS